MRMSNSVSRLRTCKPREQMIIIDCLCFIYYFFCLCLSVSARYFPMTIYREWIDESCAAVADDGLDDYIGSLGDEKQQTTVKVR